MPLANATLYCNDNAGGTITNTVTNLNDGCYISATSIEPTSIGVSTVKLLEPEDMEGLSFDADTTIEAMSRMIVYVQGFGMHGT